MLSLSRTSRPILKRYETCKKTEDMPSPSRKEAKGRTRDWHQLASNRSQGAVSLIPLASIMRQNLPRFVCVTQRHGEQKGAGLNQDSRYPQCHCHAPRNATGRSQGSDQRFICTRLTSSLWQPCGESLTPLFCTGKICVLICCFLSSPIASLDAQSVDSRPSCEACLCRAECVYEMLDLSRALLATSHQTQANVRGVMIRYT